MGGKRNRDAFERVMLPHLASAHHLALWLLRHRLDAEDAVQNAYLRAFRGFSGWRGENAAAWLLKIVRNTCMTQPHARSQHANVVHLDASPHDCEFAGHAEALADEGRRPDARVAARAEQRAVREAVERLPPTYREVIVLRELEGLSYKEIALIADIPIGTVMSRLSRARHQLRDLPATPKAGGCKHEL